jgi:2-polyprenyl-6-methoxyphenol hydroxylase-like FAD-dependent oxidoreductase
MTSRALAVQARTLELFEQRELSQEMLEIGNIANAATIYGDGKSLGKVQLEKIESRYNFILLLSQAETERILREQLDRQGVSIEWGTEAIAIAQLGSSSEPGRGSVRAVLRDREGNLEELEASYLISAEGAHSMTRRTLNLQFEGKSLRENYALADLYLDGNLPDDELSIFATKQGLMAVFPMGNRHFRFIVTDPEGERTQADSEPTLAELQKLYDQNSHIPVRLRDMTWSSRFQINSRMVHNLRQHRVFLGGDTAHIHSPAGGQGMNTGIQDMTDLSWKLAMVWQGKATPEILNTYEEERLPVIRSVVTKSEVATSALTSGKAIVHQLITHIAPLLLDTQFVQQLSTEFISEIVSNYRDSALSQTHHASGSLRAGDRVPNLQVSFWEDDALREAPLYDLLNPSCFTLLLVGDSNTTFSSTKDEVVYPWQPMLKVKHITAATSKEAAFQFHDAFGSDRGLLLVRPDSYLGFVGGFDDSLALSEWLSRWFPLAALNDRENDRG